MEITGILILISCLAVSIIWYRYRKMCPSCHKLNGLKKIEESLHSQETKYRTETKKTTYRDRHGRVTGTKETPEKVPYKVNYYNVTYKCVRCGYQRCSIEKSAKYLKEAVVIFISLIIVFIIYSNKGDSENIIKSNEVTRESVVTHGNRKNQSADVSKISTVQTGSNMQNDSIKDKSNKETIGGKVSPNDSLAGAGL
jgi:hypothetical protein